LIYLTIDAPLLPFLPSWFPGLNWLCFGGSLSPTISRFLHLSYSQELALENSYSTREIIKSEAFQRLREIVVISDKDSKSLWGIEGGGTFNARATGGQVTGFGAGVLGSKVFAGALIGDDLLKPDDAYSYVKRSSINNRYNSTIRSRINGTGTPIILIGQRLHVDDIFGFLLADGSGEDWVHLSIPTEDENGAVLWELMNSKEDLKKIKRSDPYTYSAQHMQQPVLMDGQMIQDKWWQYYEILPKLEYRIIVADTAQKIEEANDYSVFQCWGYGEDKNAYLVDQLRGKWEAPELEQKFVAFYNKHKAGTNGVLRMSYVEDKVSGTGLIQKIQRVYKFPIKGIKRDSTDKKVRMSGVVGYIESGYVKLPKDAPWLSDFLLEHSQFPDGTHDDQADATSDGLTIIFNKVRSFFSATV